MALSKWPPMEMNVKTIYYVTNIFQTSKLIHRKQVQTKFIKIILI